MHHMNLGRVLTLLLLCLGPAAVIADEAADRAAVDASANRWMSALRERNAAALASLATSDVVVLSGNGHPLQGTRAAVDVWLRAAAISSPSFTSATKEIVVSGDVAWRVASISYRRAGSEPHAGQALEIWKRNDGAWKLHRQMSSLVIDATPRPVPSEPVLEGPLN